MPVGGVQPQQPSPGWAIPRVHDVAELGAQRLSLQHGQAHFGLPLPLGQSTAVRKPTDAHTEHVLERLGTSMAPPLPGASCIA